MFSLRTSMSLNFFKIFIFSLLLIGFSVLKVSCQNPITNIRLLDSYMTGASKFVHNPIFDGITLVLPKTQVNHHNHLRPHPRPRHNHHPTYHGHHLSKSQPILRPLQLSPVPSPFHQLLLSQMERPDYQTVFRPVILPQQLNNYRKMKTNSYKPKPKYNPKEYYYKNRRNPSKYPNSINDRLREKDYDHNEDDQEQNKNESDEEEEEEEEDPLHHHDEDPLHQQDEDPLHHHDEDPLHQQNEDPLHHHNEDMEKPTSYYDNLPPFRNRETEPLTPMFKVKSNFSNGSTKRPQSYSSHPSVPRFADRLRKPVLQSDWPKNKSNNSLKKPQSLFDSSPPFSTPDQLNFIRSKPKNNQDELLLSDSPQVPSSDYQKELPKKQRTATANQLYLKQMEKHYHKEKRDPEEKSAHAKLTQGIPKEDLESNDDPGYYPHQYAIEIRWKDRNNIHYNLDAPKGDVGDRELHSSKDLDHARHRKYKHEEEEHWHEKKWLKEGLRKAHLNGKSLPVGIVKPTLKLPEGDFSPLPVYAQPLHNGATLDEINQHFAIPTPNFRVNNRFMEWAKNVIPLNPLQNINYVTLYG